MEDALEISLSESPAIEEQQIITTTSAQNSTSELFQCPLDLTTKSPHLLHEEIICQATNEEFIKSAKFSPDGSFIVTGKNLISHLYMK